MKRLILAAALAGTVAAGTAIAQNQMPAGAPRGGMSADANGDGITTRAEASAAADRRFAALDVNRDGKLTGDELRGRMARKAANGAVTRDAYRAMMLARFDRADANHDGKVDATERQAMHAGRKGDRRGGSDGDGPRGHGGRGGHGGLAGMLRQADTNGDGVVTKAEAMAAAGRMFDRMDANHDGRINQSEMPQRRERMDARGDDRGPPPPADDNRQ